MEYFALKENCYLLLARKRVCSFLLFFTALMDSLVLLHCLDVAAPVTSNALAARKLHWREEQALRLDERDGDDRLRAAR